MKRSAHLHAQAVLEASVSSHDDSGLCPYAPQELPLVDMCSRHEGEQSNVTFFEDQAFSNEVTVSFEGLGVIAKNGTFEENMVSATL